MIVSVHIPDEVYKVLCGNPEQLSLVKTKLFTKKVKRRVCGSCAGTGKNKQGTLCYTCDGSGLLVLSEYKLNTAIELEPVSVPAIPAAYVLAKNPPGSVSE